MISYISDFRDEDFFSNKAFENKSITQYAIDVMHNLAKQKDNLIIKYDGHDLYLFKTANWHVLFYQHDNNGKVYFEKVKDEDDKPFYYPIKKLVEAAKNKESIDEFAILCDFSFASVNYDINKEYKSKRELEMQCFNARFVEQDKKKTKALEKEKDLVSQYGYHLSPTPDLLESIAIFNELGVKLTPPKMEDIMQFGYSYAQCFDPDYQKNLVSYLNKTKKLCVQHSLNQDNDLFRYNDSDNSIYYQEEKKALVFNDQNMGFVAFETGKNSWDIASFSSMYSTITEEDYYFEKKPELKELSLQIKDGAFTFAGSDMYSFHYNVFFAAEAIKEELGTTKKKKPGM
jgi:hypothetical protein